MLKIRLTDFLTYTLLIFQAPTIMSVSLDEIQKDPHLAQFIEKETQKQRFQVHRPKKLKQ